MNLDAKAAPATLAPQVASPTRVAPFERALAAWVYFLLVLVPLALFWPILASHYTLYPSDMLHELYLPFAAGRSGLEVQSTIQLDFIRYYYPQKFFLWESLRNGELPLWNPYIRGGFPQFAAQGSLTTLDPFNLLFLGLDLPRALAWRTYLQVVACGSFMFLYLRSTGLDRFSSWIGAQALALNSMFYATMFDWSPGSVLWWPLTLWCLGRAHGRRRGPWTMAAGLAMGLGLLASPLQLAVFMIFVVGAFDGIRCALMRGPWLCRVAALAPAGLAVLLGLLISSVQWLPAVELLALNRRPLGSDLPHGPLQWLLKVPAMATFYLPTLAGPMKGGMRLSEAWGSGQFFQGYFGTLPFVLAVVAATSTRDRRRWIYTVVAVAAVLTIFTPLRRFVYERFLLVFIFSGAALAAVGTHALLEKEVDSRRLRQVERGFLALLIVVTAGLLVGTGYYQLHRLSITQWTDRHMHELAQSRDLAHLPQLYLKKLHATIEHFSPLNPAIWIPLLGAFAGVFLIRTFRHGTITASRFRSAACGLVMVDLLVSARTQTAFVDLRRYPLYPNHTLVSQLQQDGELFRVLTLRWTNRDPLVLRDNMWAPYHLQSLTGDDNLKPFDVSTLGIAPPGWEGYGRELNPGILGLQNVKYVLTPASRPLPDPALRLVRTADGVAVYENQRILPRAFWVPQYSVVPEEKDALRLLNAPEFNPRELVFLDREPDSVATSHAPAAAIALVRVVRYHPHQVDLELTAPEPGIVVLADTFYPGWTATLDSRPVEILRANVAMRGVAVDAGHHKLRFRFEPPRIRIGATLAAGTVVLMFVTCLLTWIRTR